MVFAGYGVTAKDKDYDDYEGVDVDGKAVVMLRRLPQDGIRPPASGIPNTRAMLPCSQSFECL